MKRFFIIICTTLILLVASPVYAEDNHSSDATTYGEIEPRAYICPCGTVTYIISNYTWSRKAVELCSHGYVGYDDVTYTYRGDVYMCPNCGSYRPVGSYTTTVDRDCRAK